MIPLLGNVAFSEISTMTFLFYVDAKAFLIKRFGKTTTQVLLDVMAHKMKSGESLEIFLDKFM